MNDKTRLHAVKDDSIIKAIAGQRHEVVDRHRRLRRIQFERDIALVGLDQNLIGAIRLDLHLRRLAILFWHELFLSNNHDNPELFFRPDHLLPL